MFKYLRRTKQRVDIDPDRFHPELIRFLELSAIFVTKLAYSRILVQINGSALMNNYIIVHCFRRLPVEIQSCCRVIKFWLAHIGVWRLFWV